MGGAEVAIQEIAKRLEMRFDFVMITARFKKELAREEIRNGILIRRVGWGTRWDAFLLPIFGLWTAQKFLRDTSTALMWGMDISQGSAAAALTKFFYPRVPFVLSVQYGYGDTRLYQGRFGLIKYGFAFMLHQANYVTGISSYLLDVVRGFGYHGPLMRLPNGVDYEQFHSQKSHKSSDPMIITTSRLVPKNGIDILIRAMSEVKKINPHVRCIIIGDGPERKKLEELSLTLGLSQTVEFLGHIAYEELPRHLGRAHIFVRPSRTEGMGNSFVEALAAGLPIIGTAVGGIPDIIKPNETGLLVRPEDAHDLAEKIIWLLNNPDSGAQFAKTGAAMVEKEFSWNGIAENFGKVVSDLIKKKNLAIVIATPLWPPELGGPGTYAKNLAHEFETLGHKVSVVSFVKDIKRISLEDQKRVTFVSLSYPTGIRHLIYLLKLLPRTLGADVIFALDQFSAGFPAAIASIPLTIPLVTRLEGDFLWEMHVARTREDTTLADFYKNEQFLTRRERISQSLVSFVIQSASQIGFSSNWRKNMVQEHYHIPATKIALIKNVWPHANTKENVRSHTIVWAGRMLYLKNLKRLIRAFANIKSDFSLELIGEGPELARLQEFVQQYDIHGVTFLPPLKHGALIEKIASSMVLVLPSLSDVGPNIIADAVSTKTPFIMTRESGYREYFNWEECLINPLDEKELEEKLRLFMNPVEYKKILEKVSNFSLHREWREAARDWVKLFYKSSHLPAG